MTAAYQAGLLLVIGFTSGGLASALWHIRQLHTDLRKNREDKDRAILLAETRMNEALDRLMAMTQPGTLSELRHFRPAMLPVVAHPEMGNGQYVDPEDEEWAHDATGLISDYG